MDGEYFVRKLYGYKDTKQHYDGNWAFKAGTAVSVIASLVGLAFGPLASTIATVVGLAGGLILGYLEIKQWVKDYFWKYKVEQTRPETFEIVCQREFIYKTEKKIELNGDEAYWETIYEEEQWEIEYERNQVLEFPLGTF